MNAFAEAKFVILERNAVAGGGLAGDGEACGLDSKAGFEFDSSAHFEDDGAWAFG